MAMDFGQTIRLGRHSRNPFRRQPVSAADDVDLQSAYIKNIDIYAAPIPTLQSDQQQNRMAQRKQERHDSGCFDMTASSTGSSSPLLDLASSAEGRQDFSRSEIQPLSPRRQNGNVRVRHQHPSTADLIHSAHLCHGEPQKLSMRDLRKQEYSRHEPTKSITRKPVHIGSCAQNHDLVPAPLTMPGTSALNKFHAAVARYKQLSTYTSEEDFEGCKPYMPSPAASYVRPQLQVPHGGLEYHPFSTVNDDVTGRFDYADDHEDVSDPFSDSRVDDTYDNEIPSGKNAHGQRGYVNEFRVCAPMPSTFVPLRDGRQRLNRDLSPPSSPPAPLSPPKPRRDRRKPH